MKRIVLLLLLSVLFFACSSDQKVKRKLHSGNGKWEIAVYKRYFWSPSGTNSQNTYLCENCGVIEFEKDGSGVLAVFSQGASGNFEFTYSNTEDILTLLNHDGEAVYDITWNLKRTQMTLSQKLKEEGYVNILVCKKK